MKVKVILAQFSKDVMLLAKLGSTSEDIRESRNEHQGISFSLQPSLKFKQQQ